MQRNDSSSAMFTLASAYGEGDEDDDAPLPDEVDYNISDEDDDTPNPKGDSDSRSQPDKRPRSITPDSNPKPSKMERKGMETVCQDPQMNELLTEGTDLHLWCKCFLISFSNEVGVLRCG